MSNKRILGNGIPEKNILDGEFRMENGNAHNGENEDKEQLKDILAMIDITRGSTFKTFHFNVVNSRETNRQQEECLQNLKTSQSILRHYANIGRVDLAFVPQPPQMEFLPEWDVNSFNKEYNEVSLPAEWDRFVAVIPQGLKHDTKCFWSEIGEIQKNKKRIDEIFDVIHNDWINLQAEFSGVVGLDFSDPIRQEAQDMVNPLEMNANNDGELPMDGVVHEQEVLKEMETDKELNEESSILKISNAFIIECVLPKLAIYEAEDEARTGKFENLANQMEVLIRKMKMQKERDEEDEKRRRDAEDRRQLHLARIRVLESDSSSDSSAESYLSSEDDDDDSDMNTATSTDSEADDENQ